MPWLNYIASLNYGQYDFSDSIPPVVPSFSHSMSLTHWCFIIQRRQSCTTWEKWYRSWKRELSSGQEAEQRVEQLQVARAVARRRKDVVDFTSASEWRCCIFVERKERKSVWLLSFLRVFFLYLFPCSSLNGGDGFVSCLLLSVLCHMTSFLFDWTAVEFSFTIRHSAINLQCAVKLLSFIWFLQRLLMQYGIKSVHLERLCFAGFFTEHRDFLIISPLSVSNHACNGFCRVLRSWRFQWW